MANGAGHWITTHGGQHVFIDGGSEKAIRARGSEVKFTKRKMAIALAQEARIASAIHGKDIGDNEPFDVIAGSTAVEVKTLIEGKNPKITMRADAITRKLNYAKVNGYSPMTVVVDTRGSSPIYYYKAGVGSFRLSSMTQTTLPALRGIIHG
jgi:hypothetical protein